MKEYLNTLIVTVVVSQLAVQFAPSKESAKKYIRLICGIVVLLCLIEPITVIIKNGGDFLDRIKNSPIDSPEEAHESDKYSSAAATIMTYISDKYKIADDKIKMTFITDESDEKLIEMHIYIIDCTSDTQQRIEYDLSGELSVPVYVFAG